MGDRQGYPVPTHRRLQAFAFDPVLGRAPLHRITIDVPYEPLGPGPRGARIHVIDFDGAARHYLEPVDLDDPLLLLQDGLAPSESDPRFHQQMVYAVSMKVLENFDIALGRRFYFRARRPLIVFPHAFLGANAFYDPQRSAVLFGYFPANRASSGPNLPGQPVFACLSHDIIAHEITHAITHRLRKYFLEPTNHDVLAFHEAFSDVVAIFQHFTFRDVLRQTIQESQGDLRHNSPLVQLAEQFGYATGRGSALRSAIDTPDARRFSETLDPHDRGAILVAAIFDAFFRTYQRRIEDLLRIASGGTGRMPQGAIHPDLVSRLAEEASQVAQATLRMCIRAFDYLPPIDVTFGDYLRALVTADFELNPRDVLGLRHAMTEAFRERGIFPDGVRSLSEDELLWPRADLAVPESGEKVATLINDLASSLIQEASNTSRNSVLDSPTQDDSENTGSPTPKSHGSRMAAWAKANAGLLALDPAREVEPVGFHPVFRVGRDGQLLVEVVLQFAQRQETPAGKFGGIPVRGGTTVVVQANGRLRYVIPKPLPSDRVEADSRRRGKERIDRQQAFVSSLDERETLHIWQGAEFEQSRIRRLMNLARLHGAAR